MSVSSSQGVSSVVIMRAVNLTKNMITCKIGLACRKPLLLLNQAYLLNCLLLFVFISPILYLICKSYFMPSSCLSLFFLLISFHSPSVSLCSLTEHGRKYKASIFIRVSEKHPVSLLLGNTGECSRSFRLADHSWTRGSCLLWLCGCHCIAQISLTNASGCRQQKSERYKQPILLCLAKL